MLKIYTLDNQFIKKGNKIPDNFTGIIQYSNGTKYWYLNGKLHRIDGPAIENLNGSKEWYLNGKLHRIDGPAIEYADGTKFCYINGKEYTEEQHKLYVDILKLKGLL